MTDNFIAPGAVVTGNVLLEKDVNVWYNATIRGNRDEIIIHEGTNVQDNAVIHTETGFTVEIGSYVSIGHGAVVHGCKVGDGSLIGMGAIIMNGAKIGKECIIAAGALVAEGKEIPDRSLVIGVPGKILRSVTDEEVKKNKNNAERYIAESKSEREQYGNC